MKSTSGHSRVPARIKDLILQTGQQLLEHRFVDFACSIFQQERQIDKHFISGIWLAAADQKWVQRPKFFHSKRFQSTIRKMIVGLLFQERSLNRLRILLNMKAPQLRSEDNIEVL
ncbi:hypothetical protein L1887_09268 [Cichorium endivia]|nr:hypothetical protein L1887_09268 [Cichorium endivia]